MTKKKRPSVLRLAKAVHKKKKPTAMFIVARKTIRRNQPLHRRIALEPVSVLALMCIGVLLAAFTLHAVADTVTVGAVVPAPELMQAAAITSPGNGLETDIQALIVSGTCPDNSYVDLSDNGIFAGTVMCASNAFQISLDLSSGSNLLQVQDYNITDAPGPASPPVTVTYVPGMATSSTGTITRPPTAPITSSAVKTPVATPVLLRVTQVDLTIPYISPNLTPIVSHQPTVTGIAPPYSYISITISSNNSNTKTCTTYANAQGYWSCTFPVVLAPGVYTVDISAKTPQGATLTIPTFTFQVIAASPSVLALPQPFRITSNYTYRVENIRQPVSFTIHITGGRAPYAFTIDWADGNNSTIIQQTADNLVISHTYAWVDASLASKVIKIQAVDASGQTSSLQFDALIRNPVYGSAVGRTTKSDGLGKFFSDMRPWLWLLWPGYLVVILLVFSFWLGEREELATLMTKKPVTKMRHRHAHR